MIRNIASIGGLMLATLIVSRASAAKPYAIGDLQALSESRAFLELAEHLGDVPPSKRDAAWTKLAEGALIGLLDEAAATGDSLAGVAASETLLDRYPTLKRSRAALDRRAEVGLAAFRKCYGAGYSEGCGEALFAFVVKDPEHPSLALEAAKLTRREMKAWYAAPLFRRAVKKAGDAACKDEDLALSVVSAVGLPADSPDLGKALSDGKALAELCYSELKAQLESAVNDGGYARTNLCAIVSKRSDAGKIARKTCDR